MNTTEVKLMTLKDMARELQMSFGTLKVLIKKGTLPKLRPLGPRIRDFCGRSN